MSGDVSGDGVDAAAGHSSNGTTFLSLATGSERNRTSPHVHLKQAAKWDFFQTETPIFFML